MVELLNAESAKLQAKGRACVHLQAHGWKRPDKLRIMFCVTGYMQKKRLGRALAGSHTTSVTDIAKEPFSVYTRPREAHVPGLNILIYILYNLLFFPLLHRPSRCMSGH